jgi:PAS domain S-box-containing protein
MKPCVLIVDDSLTVRMDLSEAFASEGFATIECATIAAARAACREPAFDLAILDVILPDGDGIELLAEMKAAPATAGKPVLLLSSEDEVRDRVRGLKTGADDYVGKPYDTGNVVSRARELIAPDRGRGRERPLIVVIDDSATFRAELREALEGAGYDVAVEVNGEEGLRLISNVRPDAVLVDQQLPGIEGPEIIRQVRADGVLRRTPCLLLTASEEREDEVRALAAGADGFVHKQAGAEIALAKLTALLRRSRAAAPAPVLSSLLAPKRILAVDDSHTFLNELCEQLRGEGYDVVAARSGAEALELLAAQPVDCILLDLVMPEMSGEETCRRIKAEPAWRDIPLIILTALDEAAAMIAGINAGADDYITKTGEFGILKARLHAQLRRKQFEDETREIREQLHRREMQALETITLREANERLERRVQERTAELARANETLRQSEERFRLMVESVHEYSIVMLDPEGRVVSWNEGAERMSGYAAPEVIGQLFTRFYPADEIDRGAHVTELAVAGEHGRFDTEGWRVRKDGSRFWASVVVTAIRDPHGKLRGFSKITRDMTARKQAEEEIRQLNVSLEQRVRERTRQLEEANRELESFSYSVSHDLRAPLRAVNGFSGMLARRAGPQLDAESRRYLQAVQEAAERMGQLIEDLLGLAKVTRQAIRRERVDLGAEAKTILANLRATAPAERVVDVEIDADLIADGDRGLLRIVLENLLSNAWKFTAKRERAHIRFGRRAGEGQASVFFVQDNGAGFDMKFADKLFGAFQRMHDAREFAGTGVGLATVARVVARHGGKIWAESAVNQGATFFFTLAAE